MSPGEIARPAGPTFFGIGAQKAGTSWLYKVLSSYPGCGLPPHKELHFWDTRHGVTRPVPYVRRLERAAEIAAQIAAAAAKATPPGSPSMFADGFLAGSKAPALIEKLSGYLEPLRFHDLDSYVRYLDRQRRPSNGLAGEITPAYSLLPREGFAEMAERFAGARFIFIMRDPVERAWSHLRFDASRRADARPGDALRRAEAPVLDPAVFARSDYRTTIERLESVVAPDRVHYMEFEALTDPERVKAQMRALEAFLGLPPMAAEALKRSVLTPENPSPAQVLSPEGRARMGERMAPVYRFVRERFGALPQGWADPG